MEKIYKLNKAPYEKINAVRTRVDYNARQGGYLLIAELIEKIDWMDGNVFGKPFCKEYYQHNGDGHYLIIPCSRRSAKRQSEAEKIFEEKSRECAEVHIKHVNEKLGTDVSIAEEA